MTRQPKTHTVTHVNLGTGEVTYETVVEVDQGEARVTAPDEAAPWTKVEHSGPRARKVHDKPGPRGEKQATYLAESEAGMSYKEIAARHGRTVEVIRAAIHCARKRRGKG